MELKRSQLARGGGVLLAAFLTTTAYPCGQGSGTPSILSTLGGSALQPYAINQAGNFTGFSYVTGDVTAHAFLYSGGNTLDLGSLDGTVSVGVDINASGQVAGYSYFNTDFTHGILVSSGNMIDLGTLGGSLSKAYAINDSGLVVGESLIEDDLETHAISYLNGTLTDLGTLGGIYGSARDVNNSGTIIGESYDTNDFTHAFSYSGGIMTDLGTLGGDISTAIAINNSGVIVGDSSTANGETHAFSYSGGIMTDLGTLGGTFSNAKAVNDAGQVIGFSTTTMDEQVHGYIYSNGTMTDLGTLGGVFSQPWALNNLGQVVGDSDIANGATHAFLWQNGVMVDLNTLIPTNSGWVLVSAMLINDAGRIVGSGIYNDQSAYFVLDLGIANSAPIANAGAEQTVDCQTAVNLTAAGSTDPDGDVITYQWTQGSTILGTNVTLTGTFDLGNHSITLTVTDPCGASSQTNVVLHVLDSTAPTITCPAPVAVSADANCQGAVPNLAGIAVTSDNCSAPASLVITQNPAAGTLVGLGSHPVTLTVSDASGNQNSCSTSFSVVDTTAPVIVNGPALGNIPVGTNCLAIVPSVTNQVVVTDNCTPANQLRITQNPLGGSTVPRGSQTIIVTVTDAASNSVSGSLSFNAVDITPPVVISAPTNLTLNVTSNCQAAVPNVANSVIATDNCGATNSIVKTQTPAAGTLLAPGTYSVTVTARDTSSNSVVRVIPLIVRDLTAPTIVSSPAPFVIAADTNCSATVPDVTGSIVASDNCTPANQLVITQSPAAGGSVSVGQHFITVSIRDEANNLRTNTVSYRVVDTAAPSIVSVPAPIIVSTGSNCSGTVPNVIGSVVTFDNCTPANLLSITQSPAAGTTLAAGQHNITITVRDAATNSTTATVSLTVADTVAPSIVNVPGPITVSADANCSATVPSVVANVVASDTCTAANQLVITQSPAAGVALGIGQHAISITVTDAAGNTASSSVSFTVVDTTAPVIVSVGNPITVASDANCQAVLPNLLGNVVASDNCSPANQLVIAQSPVAGTVLPRGQHTITITVTDVAGNSSSSTVLFTVADQTAPVIQSVTATPNTFGSPNGAMIPVTVSVVAADNCDASPVNKIISITANESVNAGDIQITGNLTATLESDRNPGGNGRIYTITVESKDASGNASTSTVTVTVPKGGNGNGNGNGNGPKNK